MEKLKIKFAKFYQGVVVANNSNQTSVKAVYEKTTNEPRLITIEHVPNTGLLIVTELASGEEEHTLVPYNNVAYVNHELVSDKKDKEQKSATKATTAMKPAAQAAKASSEPK